MLYHVIIALNPKGKRKIGQIISVLEKKGLELVEIGKKAMRPQVVKFPNTKLLVVQHLLGELEAMNYYRERFSETILQAKLNHFYGNHVELFFENEEIDFDPQDLWEDICSEVFKNEREFPIMFVVTTSGENGINVPFIPDDLDLERPCRMRLHTLRPRQD